MTAAAYLRARDAVWEAERALADAVRAEEEADAAVARAEGLLRCARNCCELAECVLDTARDEMQGTPREVAP
jgi:hypothetical protein